jgi:cephalosporin-C deacetylase-like acetyl esterase
VEACRTKEIALTRRSLLGTLVSAPALAFAPLDDKARGRPRSSQELREMFEEYLKQKAAELTEKSLSQVTDLASWERIRPELKKRVLSMLGLDPLPARTPLRARTTGVLSRNGYRVEKVIFESMPHLYVTANLYLPETSERVPVVLYLCGHNPSPAGAKFGYQHHGIWLARHGFAALLVDTIEFAEVPGIHHGIYNLEMWYWLSLGYTPAGVEVWNGMRAIDYLATRPEADLNRLGVTGISGGGIVSWYLPAVDDRVRVVASVCGSWTAETQLALNAVQENCDCVYFPNRFRLDLPAIGALIAPRPFKILGAKRDEMFPTAGYRDAHRRVGRIYSLYRKDERVALYEHDAPHQDIPAFRKEADEWLDLWLREDRTPFDEGTIERESPDTLRVLDEFPPGAVNDHIDRMFIRIPPTATYSSLNAWEQRKLHLAAVLREETFSAFPTAAPALDPVRAPVQDWTERYSDAFRVEFSSEPGLRLAGQLYLPRAQDTRDALIWLEGDDDLIDPVNHDRILPALGRHVTLVMQPRGVGYGLTRQRLTTLKRSAAILGATLESMQVWDALRAVDYVITTQPRPFQSISLFARQNMSVAAIYAAALDPRITRVILEDPPSTHWHGPAMMNVLRTTDLSEVAAMIAPRQLVFLTRAAAEFDRTRSIYRLYPRKMAFREADGLSEALELR